jgi:hypothetical protein
VQVNASRHEPTNLAEDTTSVSPRVRPDREALTTIITVSPGLAVD